MPVTPAPAETQKTEKAKKAVSKWPDFDTDPKALAFLAALQQLPSAASDSQADRQAQIDAIAKLLRNFQHPANTTAFITLQEQGAILQRTLAKLGNDSPLHTPLMAVWVGTSNLQFQMSKWMQDVMLSDGTPPESNEW
ncbi:hypothetical protein BI347_20125 [Chromobacterium sphagni]|uniref:Uncharacterized protein n=2 Tax=Chromobacterium sphagni TaxID=1903179 RepID=A0A1S1WV67_9NEIS|nr:hypothetical protein BI347_20125 [Chromobacterium sphagni]OHX19688.1 hypothetical protein BI344_17175 [Chromobacterium sphagni]